MEIFPFTSVLVIEWQLAGVIFMIGNLLPVIWVNTSYELRVASYELLVESLKARVESLKARAEIASLNVRV